MDGKKIDQLWHEAPEDREPPPRPGGAGGSSAGSEYTDVSNVFLPPTEYSTSIDATLDVNCAR